jgi:hypothetical protein
VGRFVHDGLGEWQHPLFRFLFAAATRRCNSPLPLVPSLSRRNWGSQVESPILEWKLTFVDVFFVTTLHTANTTIGNHTIGYTATQHRHRR